MSEGGGEALGPPYVTTGGFHTSQPPTPSSTVPDSADPKTSSGLPPFSSFTATELVTEGLAARLGPEGYGTETYTTGRILDFPSWGYFEEGLSGRLMDRGDGVPMLIPQTQYTRPWESKPIETITQDGFTKTYEYPVSPASKLPSFQSQFNAFPDQNGETISLTTLTPAPPSPNSNNSGLPSFHTLSTVTVNPRGYPLVPAPVQPREIPHIQQQFIDERHIQLFQSPATLNNAQYHQLSLSSANAPGIIQGNFVTHPQPPQQAALLAVVKTEPVAIVTTPLHQQPTIYQNSNTTMQHESIKVEENASTPRIVQDSRKKERRKPRASSLENSESDGVGSSSVESSGQVAAISSTANFKSPLIHQNMSQMGNVSINSQHSEMDECENGSGEKQTKKKRKRCGECIGCQRKDNCGECAPCRNDKSHQICKMRRCEKLTDKKHLLYLQNDFTRTESRRGRGKGSRASYRNKGGRGANNTNQNQGSTTPQQTPTSGTVTPQPAATHPQTGSAILTLNGNEQSPNPNMMTTTDQSPGSVMPFYGSNIATGNVTDNATSFPPGVREHRFTNAVWQQTTVPTDAASMGTWPQGQFIQQLPPHQIEDIRYHPQYPNAAVTVSSYTQPTAAYQSAQNNFLQSNGPAYNASQPPAASPLMNGGNTPRPNATVNGGIEYVDASPRPNEYMNGAYPSQDNTLVSQPPSTPNSRCSSVQNMDSNTNDSGNAVIAPSKTPTTVNNYVQQSIGTPSQGTNPGNAMPGYPPQQPPQSQQSLHNSSGYPGQNSQSVTHRYIGEEMKSPYPGVVNEENATANKEWSSRDQQNTNKTANSGWTTSVSMANGEKLNPPVYQTADGGSGTYRNEDRANVNNKLKTMILSKQHANQNRFSQNQTYQNQDGQYHHQQQQQQQHQQQHHQNQQFCAPTPPPASPVQTQQPHHVTQSSPSNMQLSSQHFQFSSQNCSSQSGQQQRQYQQTPLHSPQMQQMKSPEQQYQQQMHQMQMQQQQQQQMEQHQLNQQYQQLQQQQLQQQHLQQQQQQLQKQEASPKSYYDNSGSRRSSMDGGLMSPRNENGTPQSYQQMQQKQYNIENFTNKASINSNNFLAQGHHPRNLATEGGGYWDTSPTNKNLTYFRNQYLGPEKICGGTAKENQLQNRNQCSGVEKLESKDIVAQGNNETLWRGHEESSRVKISQTANQIKSETAKQTSSENKFSVPMILGEIPDKVAFSDRVIKTEPSEETFCENNVKISDEIETMKNNVKTEMPICDCFPPDKIPSEPGSYYTHLGKAASLPELRQDLENRTGYKGNAIRIEKILYTGKEGKTAQGCPIAKWIIRRASNEEKLLVVVKHRLGHRCSSAWIVVVLVAWEGVPNDEADQLYSLLVHKLNKYGLPTVRRCATNESRNCACQGLDPESCGTSFSFGCSWSMYYNGCKYARSKNVRKFRLSVKNEEQEVEDRLNKLATLVAPLYQKLAPDAYKNMTEFESQASDCRLGVSEGRPFSGVTACVDFCAHSHRDMHNMNNGLTCVVNLTKHRELSKPDDEQLHVLPLYTVDDTDEFDDAENQANKIRNGSIEVLTKYRNEVRVRHVPLQPCRRHGKGKRKEPDSDLSGHRTASRISPVIDGRISRASSIGSDVSHGFDGVDSQLQSSQVSSTVLDSPGFSGRNYSSQGHLIWNHHDNDADSTTLSRSQYPSDSRNHFVFPHSSPIMNFPRTPTPSRPPTSHSQYSSPSTLSDEWSMSGNSDSWDISSPRIGSPYVNFRTAGNVTPVSRSNPQSPSVDSFHSPSRNFIKPYPPLDGDGMSASYRSQTKAKRNITDDLNRGKSEVRKLGSEKVSIGINTPDTFALKFEDKGTSVDASIFASPSPLLPQHNLNVPRSSSWSGVNDIMKPLDPRSSLMNSNSPFIPHFNYGLPVSPATAFTSPSDQLISNRSGFDVIQPHVIKREEKQPMSGYQSPLPLNPYQVPRWDSHSSAQSPFVPDVPESPKSESLGELMEITDNEECFKDKQMGGVAIAVGHGTVIFECAKHELHSTTALRKPNRRDPSRISLVFYQHRNLNRGKHGCEEWEEKIKLKKMGLLPATPTSSASPVPVPSPSPVGGSSATSVVGATDVVPLVPNVGKSPIDSSQFMLHANPFPTLTGPWTTLFPMHPCVTSGQFKDKQLTDVR